MITLAFKMIFWLVVAAGLGFVVGALLWRALAATKAQYLNARTDDRLNLIEREKFDLKRALMRAAIERNEAEYQRGQAEAEVEKVGARVGEMEIRQKSILSDVENYRERLQQAVEELEESEEHSRQLRLQLKGVQEHPGARGGSQASWRRPVLATNGDAHEPAGSGSLFDDLDQLTTQPDDDLTKIPGVGPAVARTLKRLGIATFRQLATLGDSDLERVREALPAFPASTIEEGWMKSARRLHERAHGERVAARRRPAIGA